MKRIQRRAPIVLMTPKTPEDRREELVPRPMDLKTVGLEKRKETTERSKEKWSDR